VREKKIFFSIFPVKIKRSFILMLITLKIIKKSLQSYNFCFIKTIVILVIITYLEWCVCIKIKLCFILTETNKKKLPVLYSILQNKDFNNEHVKKVILTSSIWEKILQFFPNIFIKHFLFYLLIL